MRATTSDAVRLMHEGTLALSKVESTGIKIDTDYLDATRRAVKSEMAALAETLKKDEVWRRWRRRFGDRAKLGSIEQLGKLLFEDMGYTVRGRTVTGRIKMTEQVLRSVDLPFVSDYIRLRKLQKVYSTYLNGVLRETLNGVLRPSFTLHMTTTYRSSCRDPNFQNIPIRDKEFGALIRKCFVGRGRLLEIDFSQIEVRIAACYTKDPKLISYILDPTTDMHWDTAKKLFQLPPGETVAHHKKGTRDAAKNLFVFPQFYGSYYADCARGLWDAMNKRGLTLQDGTLVSDHLKAHGITRRGKCDDQRPERGTFERRVQEAENWMWHEQYTVYRRWRENWWKEYLKTGAVWMYTGFVCRGVYRRNQVINTPVQGSAFHCLLWAMIRLVNWLEDNGFEARVIAQIHDCILVDCPDDEVQAVLTRAKEIMTVELPEAWPWIIVPLETEADVTPVGGNWHDKRPWVQNGSGVWGPVGRAA